MNELSIEPKYFEELIKILEDFCPDCLVLAYGSRINKKSHEGSDLDLAIKNFPAGKNLFELKKLFSESNIPFLIDVNIYENLPLSFQNEIDKNCIKIYPSIV